MLGHEEEEEIERANLLEGKKAGEIRGENEKNKRACFHFAGALRRFLNLSTHLKNNNNNCGKICVT